MEKIFLGKLCQLHRIYLVGKGGAEQLTKKGLAWKKT